LLDVASCYPVLEGHETTDICVVGAVYTGIARSQPIDLPVRIFTEAEQEFTQGQVEFAQLKLKDVCQSAVCI
jgi:hypothetical protein